MKSLDRKLFRDLAALRGQAAAIALVVACGIAIFVTALSTLDSLERTRAGFYAEARFADVFAELVRAPESAAARIAALPGVTAVQTRVVTSARLELPGLEQLANARMVSLPREGRAALNRVSLRAGRMPRTEREALVSDAFAEARGLQPGAELRAVIEGQRMRLTVVGLAVSPEFIFLVPPGGLLPDAAQYGVVWVSRDALAGATDMDGAFNELALTVAPGAATGAVLDAVDQVLAPYGGRGAIARADHESDRALSEELEQIAALARLLPALFLAVAAFLLSVVVGRIVGGQREQIGALKALGYSDLVLGLHYLKLVLVIVLAGGALGILLGSGLGAAMTQMYAGFFRFPVLSYRLGWGLAAGALAVGVLAGVVGALATLRRVVALPPAIAMKPEPPARYRAGLLERVGASRFLSQTGRMVVRHLERRPGRSLGTVMGISFAFAILVMAGFIRNAAARLVEVQFTHVQREDLTVSFTRPSSQRAVPELRAIPGVRSVEPFRTVPVRLVAGERSFRTAVQGLLPEARLRTLVGSDLRAVHLPPGGVVLTTHLAERLGLVPGDLFRMEVLEGERRVREVRLAGVVDEYVGLSAYMRIDALNRMLGEGAVVSGAFVAADDGFAAKVARHLETAPRVAGTTVRAEGLRTLQESIDRQIVAFSFVLTLFATVIAFGVVYNSARIVLAERTRELATLRVMGFTRAEVAAVLNGEIAALTLVALPIGAVLGWLGSAGFVSAVRTDTIRLPLVLGGGTMAFAALVVVASSAAIILTSHRRLDRLDLIAVLKTND